MADRGIVQTTSTRGVVASQRGIGSPVAVATVTQQPAQQPAQAVQTVQGQQIDKLAKYTADGKSYSIAMALKDRAVTPVELQDMGFAQDAVERAGRYVEQTGKLAKYTDDGQAYRITEALKDRAVTISDLRDIGFEERGIRDAVVWAKLGPAAYIDVAPDDIKALLSQDTVTRSQVAKLLDQYRDKEYSGEGAAPLTDPIAQILSDAVLTNIRIARGESGAFSGDPAYKTKELLPVFQSTTEAVERGVISWPQPSAQGTGAGQESPAYQASAAQAVATAKADVASQLAEGRKQGRLESDVVADLSRQYGATTLGRLMPEQPEPEEPVETVHVRDVGTLTQDIIDADPDNWPGFKPGDRYGILESGETIALAPGENVISRVEAAGARESARQLSAIRETVSQARRKLESENVIIGGLAMPIADWNKLSPKEQELAKTDPRGFEAIKDQREKDAAEFNRTHTDVGGGRYLPNSVMERVKTETPELYQTLASKGYDAYISEIDAIDAQIKAEAAKLAEQARVSRQKAEEALATSLSDMNRITSPDFLREGGSPVQITAVLDAMRRAGFQNPDVPSYRALSEVDKAKIAPRFYADQNIVKDVLREAITLGQIKTATFDENAINEQYTQETAIARAIYQGDEKAINELSDRGAFGGIGKDNPSYLQALQFAKESKGTKKAESESNFLDRAVGDKYSYAKEVVKAQPLLGEMAKEFIPFRQLLPAEIEKTKASGEWLDFGVRTLFDIAMVVPIAGWISKGVQAGLKAASLGAKVAALGGRTGLGILRNEAKNTIVKEAEAVAAKRIEVKVAQNALKEAVATGSPDIGLRRESLQLLRSELSEARADQSARIALAKQNFSKLDGLYKQYVSVQASNPLKLAVEERAYLAAARATGLASVVSKPAWYAYGSAEGVRTAKNWDTSSPIEKLISLGMIGVAFGVPEKVIGMTKSGFEMLTSPGRIPSRTIAVPDVYLPKGAGMPKTSVRGMNPQEQLAAMKTSAQALEDLWSGKGRASYPWGKSGLKYEPRSEFQRVVPKSMVSATPSGAAFGKPIYKVVTLKEPAQYFAPWGFPQFTKVSASGIKGARPAYLILFGSRLSKYPTSVEVARTPAEMRRVVQGLLERESLRSGAYPGFKLFAGAKEPEYVVPTGSEIGAGRNTILGRVYGGIPLWTRATPFGKRIELQPHFLLDDVAARRSGFTLAEAHSLKMLGIESELKNWLERAQFWKRGIAGESGLVGEIRRSIKREPEPSTEKLGGFKFETETGFRARIKQEIESAKRLGDKEQVKYLRTLEKNTLRDFRSVDRLYREGLPVYDDLLRATRTPELSRLLEEFRLLEASRRSFLRAAESRVLDRLRTAPGELRQYERPETLRELLERPEAVRVASARLETMRGLDRAAGERVEPVRPQLSRLETTRPELGRPDITRPEITRPELTRPEPSRPEPTRPEPSRPEPTRPEPSRPEPTRPEPTRPEPVRPEPIKPKLGIPVLARLQTSSPMSQPIPAGSIAWAMGQRKGVRGLLVPQWYFIPPPYDQLKPISLSAPPTGALRTDSIRPKETIQVIGMSRAEVPRRVTMDLGFADITIINGRQIEFAGGGLATDYGSRIASNTTGMELDGGGIMDEGVSGVPVSFSRVNRTKHSKKAPRRVGRDEPEAYTILGGMK